MTTLSEEIKKFQGEFIKENNIPESIIAIMEKETAKLKDAKIADKALKAGDLIQDFTLPNAIGENVTMSDIIKENDFAVISFYRGAWCPYCNLELRALQQINPQLKELNAKLIAISPIAPDDSLDIKEKYELDFEVLSDLGNTVAKQFGIVFKLADVLKELYKSFDIDIAASNRDDKYELPMPATYIVNKKCEIICAFVDEDYTKRCEPQAIIDVIKQNS